MTIIRNSFAIVAHPSRFEQARSLYRHLPGSLFVLDEDNLGNGRNHLRAWQMAAEKDADWYTVLEDDAILCPNFLRHLGEAQESAPTSVVSWYLGTGRPIRFQRRLPRRLEIADLNKSPWLVSSFCYHAVAISIRKNLIEEMLDFCSKIPDEAADNRLTMWSHQNRHLVAYSKPSLVEHADGKSFSSTYEGPRRAWRFGEPTKEWNGSVTPF